MRTATCVCAILVMAALTRAAGADVVCAPEAPPFSAADIAAIGRNTLLHAVVARDPWLVRHILDLQPRGKDLRSGSVPVPVPGGQADDPDLVPGPRDAAVSAEWIGSIRQARAARAAGRAALRSSEGSLELIELMRRAKALKAGQ